MLQEVCLMYIRACHPVLLVPSYVVCCAMLELKADDACDPMLVTLRTDPILCLLLASGLIILSVLFAQDCCGRSLGRSTC